MCHCSSFGMVKIRGEHSFTVYLVTHLQTTDADKVREGCHLPNEARSIIRHLVDVVQAVSRDACLAEMLESGDSGAVYVPWVLHCYMLWVAIH